MALTASVELSSPRVEHPALWDLSVELRNTGDEAQTVPTATLFGPVSFEVVDAGGAPVALGPPPVPPADPSAGAETVQPGDALSLRFHGSELFPDAPPPGRYRLRFASGAITSPWVDFSVG